MAESHICPVERAGSLDSKIRRWIQNPRKILSPYINVGMKVLDVGCGPGYFSIEIAQMVGKSGKVFSVDLQEGMLQIIKDKIEGTTLENRIHLIKCDIDKISVPGKVDFILAFYMVHEVPDKDKLFKDLRNILEEKGTFLIVEPAFHVTKKDFALTLQKAKEAGFKVNPGPKMFLNHSAILSN